MIVEFRRPEPIRRSRVVGYQCPFCGEELGEDRGDLNHRTMYRDRTDYGDQFPTPVKHTRTFVPCGCIQEVQP